LSKVIVWLVWFCVVWLGVVWLLCGERLEWFGWPPSAPRYARMAGLMAAELTKQPKMVCVVCWTAVSVVCI
jgi:hypothetical protein